MKRRKTDFKMSGNAQTIERIVQKHGGSLIIIVGKEECKVKDIEEGDVLQFEIKKVIKKNG